MNLVLVLDHEVVAEGRAVIGGARGRHLIETLGVEAGRALRVGREGEGLGKAEVSRVSAGLVELSYRIDLPAPPAPRLDLILALPRPKVLRRILEHAPSYGLRRIVLVRSANVDRSYFESPVLQPESIEAALTKGMEQAVDVFRPEVLIEPLFRPYVEDRLAGDCEGIRGVVLHPGPQIDEFRGFRGAEGAVAIGPERGWTAFEVELFAASGLAIAGLGPRILRVESAVAWAAARA